MGFLAARQQTGITHVAAWTAVDLTGKVGATATTATLELESSGNQIVSFRKAIGQIEIKAGVKAGSSSLTHFQQVIVPLNALGFEYKVEGSNSALNAFVIADNT